MTRNEFLKQVAEGRLLPAYLFLGEERLFHEELMGAAVRKLLPGDDAAFNLITIHAPDQDPGELLTNLETPAFFGDVRVICLTGLEHAKNGMDEAILAGLGRMAAGVYLLISAMKLDGQKKAHVELQKRITVVDCNKLASRDIGPWVSRRAQAMGLALAPAQVSKVVQRAGTDLLRLRTELEKIRTYTGSGGRLTDAELDALLPEEPEPDIFGLIDAVAAGNARQGIPRLQELLDSGEAELKILATLAKQFRNIAAALEARARGMNSKKLAAELGIKPFVAEKSMVQSGRFSMGEVEKILHRLLEANFRMKTGQREPRLELELAVVEICTSLKR